MTRAFNKKWKRDTLHHGRVQFLTTENILDVNGSIIASKRFEDQNPLTPDPYANQYYFYHYDMRGSTTAIVRPNGTLTTGYSYDEFGALKQTGATVSWL